MYINNDLGQIYVNLKENYGSMSKWLGILDRHLMPVSP